MPTNYNRNTETIDTVYTTDGSGTIETNLDFFVYSFAIQNDTTSALNVYFDRYSEDYVQVAASAYKEVAVTTNYYRIEYDASSTGEEIIATIVKSQQVDDFLTPLFPNLYAPSDDTNYDEDIKMNPISAYGYTYTPWMSSDGSMYMGTNSSLLEVEYYLDGHVVSTANTTDFYGDLYTMIMDTISSFYPDDYEPPTNPEYSPLQAAEIVEKTKEYLLSYDVTFNEEFFAGYASLTSYDPDLKATSFTLDDTTNTSLATAWTVLGGTFDPGANPATIRYKENIGDSWTTVNLSGGSTQVFTDRAKYFEVTSGEVEITFNGNYVRMIDFAPIINIVYPLGTTDSGDVPNEIYATFTNKIAELQQNLQAANFTGRVVYFRSEPFTAQAGTIYNADAILPNELTLDQKYVFQAIRHHVQNYYQYSRTEEDLLKAIIHENWLHYHPAPNNEPTNLPQNLEDVIEDSSVTIRGLSTESEKKDFIVDLLLTEYTGSYSMGGFSLHTPGVTHNRQTN